MSRSLESASKLQRFYAIFQFAVLFAHHPGCLCRQSIRLSPKLILDLEKIARLRGEKSYQALLKRWVTERVEYEMELIDLAKSKKAI
jgi:hypothetical protein